MYTIENETPKTTTETKSSAENCFKHVDEIITKGFDYKIKTVTKHIVRNLTHPEKLRTVISKGVKGWFSKKQKLTNQQHSTEFLRNQQTNLNIAVEKRDKIYNLFLNEGLVPWAIVPISWWEKTLKSIGLYWIKISPTGTTTVNLKGLKILSFISTAFVSIALTITAIILLQDAHYLTKFGTGITKGWLITAIPITMLTWYLARMTTPVLGMLFVLLLPKKLSNKLYMPDLINAKESEVNVANINVRFPDADENFIKKQEMLHQINCDVHIAAVSESIVFSKTQLCASCMQWLWLPSLSWILNIPFFTNPDPIDADPILCAEVDEFIVIFAQCGDFNLEKEIIESAQELFPMY